MRKKYLEPFDLSPREPAVPDPELIQVVDGVRVPKLPCLLGVLALRVPPDHLGERHVGRVQHDESPAGAGARETNENENE